MNQYSVFLLALMSFDLPKEENVPYKPGPGTKSRCVYSGPFLFCVPNGLQLEDFILANFSLLKLLVLF